MFSAFVNTFSMFHLFPFFFPKITGFPSSYLFSLIPYLSFQLSMHPKCWISFTFSQMVWYCESFWLALYFDMTHACLLGWLMTFTMDLPNPEAFRSPPFDIHPSLQSFKTLLLPRSLNYNTQAWSENNQGQWDWAWPLAPITMWFLSTRAAWEDAPLPRLMLPSAALTFTGLMFPDFLQTAFWVSPQTLRDGQKSPEYLVFLPL